MFCEQMTNVCFRAKGRVIRVGFQKENLLPASTYYVLDAGTSPRMVAGPPSLHVKASPLLEDGIEDAWFPTAASVAAWLLPSSIIPAVADPELPPTRPPPPVYGSCALRPLRVHFS